MKKNSILCVWIQLTLLSMAMTACTTQGSATVMVSSTPTANPAPLQKTFDNPFLYCAAVGTLDTPDARYTGPQITDEIINGYKIAAGLEASTEPMEMFKKTTIWRCMDSQVYACNFGANLPCSSKANTDKTPSQAMDDYCTANPNSDFIPMSVTGHSTIYSWHCVKDTPEILDQIEKVDAAGYLAQIWYPIELNPTPKPETSSTPTMVPSATPTSLPTLTPTSLGGSSQILFASNRSGSYDDLYLLDITSSQVTRLTQGDSNTFPGPFSPDGSLIVFTGFGLTHSYVGVMAADGTQAKDLTHAEVDGSGLKNLTNDPAEDWAPSWSPDGRLMAFQTNRDGNWEIYVMNADGTSPHNLTNNPADDQMPYWR